VIFSIRALGGKVIHEVEVGDRKIVFPPDLRGVNLTNACLRGAVLPDANLEGAILIGADLSEANLRKANLKDADLRYTNLKGTDLREANLRDVDIYPSQIWKTDFWGARITPGSELENLLRQSLIEWRHFDFITGKFTCGGDRRNIGLPCCKSAASAARREAAASHMAGHAMESL